MKSKTKREGNQKKLGLRLKEDLKKNYILYVMIIPVIAYFAIFKYYPMYGLQIAFKNYMASEGFWNSPSVGFDHFERFFSSYNFASLLGNTIGISLYQLIVGFPLPIIFALFLNYLPLKRLKKTVQMASYAPHFLSVVVVCGMLTIFMNLDSGIFNTFGEALGLEAVAFLSVPEWFKSIYVWSGIWQTLGWGSIIYISALSGVDQQMHEAAIIDGASKVRRMISIDVPTIMPTIIMLFILRIGGIMNVGFEKVFLLQNDLNRSASDVLSTYVYRLGLQGGDFSFTTAVGLFNSLINFALLIFANKIARKFSETSLW